jgi:hypothetical protein
MSGDIHDLVPSRVDEALDARYFQRSPECRRVFYPFGLRIDRPGADFLWCYSTEVSSIIFVGGTDSLPDMMTQPFILFSCRRIPFKTEVWSRSR